MLGAPKWVTAESSPPVVPTENAADFSVDWLEPQGVNIIDLVGAVPELYLKGATITYTPGFGILTYENGVRNGDVTTITTRASTRFIRDGNWNGTLFSCLGQPARVDQMGTVSPATTLRVFERGRDVTREVDLFSYMPSGRSKPILNPRQSESQNRYRYWESETKGVTFTSDGQLSLPANMGCEMIMSFRNYPELTLVFTARSPRVIDLQVLGSEVITFMSYLGPGYAGHLASLVGQLTGAGYQHRAEHFDIHVPAEADYFFVNYPTTSADPYTAFPGNAWDNVNRPTSGTYRMVIGPGVSVDHVNSMGLPLRGHWQDIDQADGTWLRYDDHTRQVSAPEYFLPAGVPFDSCMINGGCSSELLRRVYNTPATMRLVYFKVTRTDRTLERLPVQMVGGGYSGQSGVNTPDLLAASPTAAKRYRIFLPGTSRSLPIVPPDDASACSSNGGCGWFTADGRMVDYIPAP